MFERLSTYAVTNGFILPHRRSKLVDHEWGGIALQNTSKGLLHSIWEAHLTGHKVYITANSHNIPVFEGTQPVKQLGLAFDVNMNYALAYLQEDEVLYWKWFDATTGQYTVSTYTGVSSVVCTLDDPRKFADTWNDIVLMYIKGDNLCCRLQRERYTQEHILSTDFGTRDLWQLGLSKNYRLQLRHYFKTGE